METASATMLPACHIQDVLSIAGLSVERRGIGVDNRAIRVFPRRKKSDDASTQVTKRKGGNAPVELTVAMISTGFHLPQAKAARAMGISATAMKSVCRRLGISSWPYARRRRDHHISTNSTSLPDGKFDAALDPDSPLSSTTLTPSYSHGFHLNVPFKPIQLEASMHMSSGKPSPSCVMKYRSASIPVPSVWDCTSTPIEHALSLSTLGPTSTALGSEPESTTTEAESTCWSPLHLGYNREISLAHFLQEREDNREDLGFLIHQREPESLGMPPGMAPGL